jgi:type IV pilus assembly protein PilN
MPRINLLPWRAELRQKRKKDFLVALLASVIVGAVLVYASKLTMQGWTASQNGRNAILKTEIEALDKQITEIQGLEAQRDRLVARMRVIDQLQRSRPEVVHLFDELVDAVPEGVHFTEVKQTATRVELQGQAQSSTRVSTLMRNIASSEFLKEPGLDVVETKTSGADRNSQFKLFASQVPMNAEEGADGVDGGAGR